MVLLSFSGDPNRRYVVYSNSQFSQVIVVIVKFSVIVYASASTTITTTTTSSPLSV